jgi:hypothetical protein
MARSFGSRRNFLGKRKTNRLHAIGFPLNPNAFQFKDGRSLIKALGFLYLLGTKTFGCYSITTPFSDHFFSDSLSLNYRGEPKNVKPLRNLQRRHWSVSLALLGRQRTQDR